jgi:hypothetical protein
VDSEHNSRHGAPVTKNMKTEEKCERLSFNEELASEQCSLNADLAGMLIVAACELLPLSAGLYGMFSVLFGWSFGVRLLDEAMRLFARLGT